MTNDRIAAGIVTYNPRIERLRENIEAVKTQVSKVYIFDNGSVNISDISFLCDESISLIKSNTNTGIAHALNSIFKCAENEGFNWLITLDQDSVCLSKMIEKCRAHLMEADSITTLRYDRNYQIEDVEDYSVQEADRCITSGNLVKISEWKRIHGFNERLFIDMVDVDFCFRLKQAGGRIIKLRFYGIQHEMGDGTQLNVLGKRIYIGNYSSFRKYYISRNMVYVIRKYHLKHHYYSYKRLILLFIYAALKEQDKKEKCKSMLRGFLDGFRQYEYIDSYWREVQNNESI